MLAVLLRPCRPLCFVGASHGNAPPGRRSAARFVVGSKRCCGGIGKVNLITRAAVIDFATKSVSSIC
jgi:hypothetical protein